MPRYTYIEILVILRAVFAVAVAVLRCLDIGWYLYSIYIVYRDIHIYLDIYRFFSLLFYIYIYFILLCVGFLCFFFVFVFLYIVFMIL